MGLPIFFTAVFDILPAGTPENSSLIKPIFNVILAYAGFAVFTNFIRELIKDAEDLEGDKAEGYRTLAAPTGPEVRYIILALLFVLLIFTGAYDLYLFETGTNLFYRFLCRHICYPTHPLPDLEMLTARSKLDFKKASILMKIIMITGILSMVVFTLFSKTLMRICSFYLPAKSSYWQQIASAAGGAGQSWLIVLEVRTGSMESYDPTLKGADIAAYLAGLKADAFSEELNENELLMTADTVVWSGGQSLAKAAGPGEAKAMLQKLSGTCHEVITGVCLLSLQKRSVFTDTTRVYFNHLSEDVIHYYIENYKPFDKAGAYGIQEWIGMWAIEKIEGSYFNVVGLPTHLIAPS
ncbi:MAG: Maf family protein [Owenweeksia sp.]|nr:Maf family protein [Owenweeksia sp.]